MWNQFTKLLGTNMKMTFREKQVWFWSILYPVFLLVVFITIFGGSGKSDSFEVNVTLVKSNDNTLSRQLEQVIRGIDVLKLEAQEPVSREQAERELKDKSVDAVIVLPETTDAKQVELLLNKEKMNSSLAQALIGIVNNVMTQLNFGLNGTTPQLSLQTGYISESNAELKASDFMLTGMIALSVAQSGLFGMIGLVEMRRNGLLKRLKLTPMNMSLFGFSDIVVRFILAMIQIVLLTLTGVIFYNATLDVNVAGFLIVFIVGTMSFSALGYLIAAISKTNEAYFGIANLFSFALMFISGIFFDVSMLPSFIKPLSHVLPLTYFANGIRDGLVYGASPANTNFWINIAVMAAWGIVAFVIGALLFRKRAVAKS